MTKDEALELALKALELVNIEFVCNGAHHAKKDRHEVGDECPVTDRYRQSIIAIKEALAQPKEPDPVAWMIWCEDNVPSLTFKKPSDKYVFDSLYTTPPQPKEPDPVAWRAPNPNRGHSDEWVYRDFDDPVLIEDGFVLKPSPNNEALYTTPPQRTWVGLTVGEIQDLIQFKEHSPFALAEDIEAKLKQKNTRGQE